MKKSILTFSFKTTLEPEKGKRVTGITNLEVFNSVFLIPEEKWFIGFLSCFFYNDKTIICKLESLIATKDEWDKEDDYNNHENKVNIGEHTFFKCDFD